MSTSPTPAPRATGPRVTHGRIAVAAALLATSLATVLTGCADGPAGAAEPPRISFSADPTGPSGSTAEAAEADSVPSAAHAVAAVVRDVSVHSAPDLDSPAVDVSAATSFGSPRVMRVVEATPDGGWLRVVVPARPNNTTGWLPADEAELRAVRHHITVDLSERTLVLTEDGAEVLRSTIAVGTADNPTPTGEFYVTDKLSTDPDGAYGSYALGLAGWSETLSEFNGGDGQVAIHGTNRPDLLGSAVSHGCVRVPNDVATRLGELLPLGVPVDVKD